MKKYLLLACVAALFFSSSEIANAKIPRTTKTKTAKSDGLLETNRRFWQSVKFDNVQSLVRFFSPQGVTFVNPVKDRSGQVDKTSYQDAAAEWLQREHDFYRPLIKGTVRDAVGETQPAFIKPQQLIGAQWQRAGNRLTVRGAKAGYALKDVALVWEKRGANWRLRELVLPFPIFG